MALPTTRANVALAIAARQLAQAKQQNPDSDPNELIDNLNAVPEVIKDFLKKKAGSPTAPLASLQNPLQDQNGIYQQMVARLIKPFAPQVSQGRAVAGMQLPPRKALEYLHSDADFQSLPKEYQDYAIGVIGGQDALNLHQNTLALIRKQGVDQEALVHKADENNLQFLNSPTKMVQRNLEEGKWFVDASAGKLMKMDNSSGVPQKVPLEPWEQMHMINEAPKLGFGDMTRYLNPQQQAGLAALHANPNASTSDIVSMVSKGRAQSGQLNNLLPSENPPEIQSQIANLQNLSPERIATMRALGYNLGEQQQPKGFTDEQLAASKAPWWNQIVDNPQLPGTAAGIKVHNFVKNIVSPPAGGSSLLDKAIAYPLAAGQNVLSAIGQGNDYLNNFITAATGNTISGPFPEGFKVPMTNVGDMTKRVNAYGQSLAAAQAEADARNQRGSWQGPPAPPAPFFSGKDTIQQIPDQLPDWLRTAPTFTH